VHTLVGLGYAQSNGRHFSLTPKILTLGYAYLSTAPPAARSHSLSLETHQLKVATNRAPSRFSRAMRSSTWLGRRAKRIMVGRPLGGVTLACVLHVDGACFGLQPFLRMRCAIVWRAPELQRFTPHTIVDPDSLREILNGVRRQGFALVDQELEIGLRSLAVSGVWGRRQSRGSDECQRAGRTRGC